MNLEYRLQEEFKKTGGPLSRERVSEIVSGYFPHVPQTRVNEILDKPENQNLIEYMTGERAKGGLIGKTIEGLNLGSEGILIGGAVNPLAGLLAPVGLLGKGVGMVSRIAYDVTRGISYGRNTNDYTGAARKVLTGMIPSTIAVPLRRRLDYATTARMRLADQIKEYAEEKHNERIIDPMGSLAGAAA